MDNKKCRDCLREFPATSEFFGINSRKNPSWLRSYCKECGRSRHSQWVQYNRQRTREIARNSYAANSKKRVAKEVERQRHLRSDPVLGDLFRTKHRLWRANRLVASPDVAERERERWRAANKTPAGRERARRASADRRARKSGAGGRFTAAEFREVLAGQGYCCFYCSADITSHPTADHYIPLSRGGSNSINNIVASCKSCNCRKNNRLPDAFAAI